MHINPKIKFSSLSKLIMVTAWKDVLFGFPFIPIYAFSELMIGGLLTILVKLIFIETPRIVINNLVPPKLKNFFFLDMVIDRKDLIVWIPFLIVAFGFVKLIASFLSSYLIERSGLKVSHALRFSFLKGYLSSGGDLLDRSNPDEIANRLVQDTSMVQGALSRGFIGALRDVLVVLGCLLSIFVLASSAFWIVFIALSPVFYSVWRVTKKLNSYNQASALAQVNLATRMLQTKNGLLSIFGIRSQDREEQDLIKQSKDYYKFASETFFLRTFFKPGMELFAVLILAATLFWKFRLGSSFESSTWSSLFIFMAIMFRPIKNVAGFISQWSEIRTVYARLLYQWQAFPILENPSSAHKNSENLRADAALDVKNIYYYSKEKRPILKNCTLEVKKGQRIALVGKSGSGKTTFLRLCAGLLSPAEGSVAISPDFLLATQFPYVFKGTVLENIEYNSQSSSAEMAQYKAATLSTSLALTHTETTTSIFLKKALGFLGFGLSGGEKARVALARVLFPSPKLLLLDEPTANLDAQSGEAFWTAIDEWKSQNQDNTIISVLHVMPSSARWDLCVIFDEGKIIAVVPPSEVRNYHELG